MYCGPLRRPSPRRVNVFPNSEAGVKAWAREHAGPRATVRVAAQGPAVESGAKPLAPALPPQGCFPEFSAQRL